MRTPLKLLLLAPAFLILAAPSHPEEMESCEPYVCPDGSVEDRCDDQGNQIQSFEGPCFNPESLLPVFADVSSLHPNADAIKYLKAENIVHGYPDGTFKPDTTINRAEFTKIIMDGYNGVEGSPSRCGVSNEMYLPFSDVHQADWFAFRVCLAAHVGVVSGYPDGTFRPAASINFVEAAKILMNTFDPPSHTGTIPVPYVGAPWYAQAVVVLAGKNAIPTSLIRFDQNITRGEMAEMVYRLKAGNSDKPSRTYEELAGYGPFASVAYRLVEGPTEARNHQRNVLMQYAITAPPDSNAEIDGQNFTILGAHWSGPRLQIYGDATMTNQIETWASDDAGESGDQAVLSGALIIPAGQTRYVALTADISTAVGEQLYFVSTEHDTLGRVTLQGIFVMPNGQ